MSIKKTQKLIDLAKKGGNNADLYILQLIEELESKLEKLDEKMPDLGMFLANVRGEDGTSIEEIEYEDGTLTIKNSEGEEYSWYVKGEDAEITEELKEEIVGKVQELIKIPNLDSIVRDLNSKIEKVAQMKNVVEVKETVIEREVIDDSTIEKLKEDNKNYLEELSKKITEQFPTDEEIRKKIKEIMPVNPPDYAGGSGATFLKSLRDIDTKDRSTTKAYLKWNPTRKVYEHVELQTGGSSVSVNGAEVTDPDFVDSNTAEFDVATSDVSVNVKGVNRVVVSGNTTATLGTYYISVATATYTDPTPAEGAGYTVMVRNGTSTVGGSVYSTAGTVILRYYHSGAWANYVQMPQGAMSGDATQATNGVVTIANDAVTFAKMQNITTARLLGRTTAGTGNVEEITPNTTNFTFTAQELAIAAVPNMFGIDIQDNIAAATTSYYGCWGGFTTDNTTENLRQSVISNGLRLSKITVATRSTQNAGGSMVITFRDDGADTALDVTVPAGAAAGVYTDTASVTIAADSLVAYKVVNNAPASPSAVIQSLCVGGLISSL